MSIISNKGKGIVGTILFHILAILLLILSGFTTPLPLPAEQGILINFGTSDDGSGNIEPKVEQDVALQKPSSTSKNDEVNPLTQDTEEAPSLPVKKEESKKKETVKKPDNTKKEDTKKTTQTETQTEKPREANKKALFPGQKVDGGNDGEGVTGKTGNQGSTEGSIDSDSRIGSTGGGGTAELGIKANLKGRTALELPKPDYPSLKSGTVVVEVTVDSQGKVIKANAITKGSTIIDIDFFKAAEKAALNAKFNVNNKDEALQIGTINYIFKLQ